MARATRVHRIRIEQATESRDTTGETLVTWALVAVVWAAVVPQQGGEGLSSQQVHADVTHRIETGYRSDVIPKMRAVFQHRVFDIQYVQNVDERNRDMVLLVLERGV